MLLPFRSILAPKTDVASGDRYLRKFTGVGDVMLSGTWLPYTSTNADRTVLALTCGLRLPTGSADPDHDWGYGNSRDPVLQPGYGTVDPLLGFSWSRALGRFGTNASAVARLSGGTNVHGYRYADEYQGTVGLTYSLMSWLDVGAAGAVLTSAHDFDKGVMVQNTGGLWGYVIPQASFSSAGVRFEPSVQIPVYSFVNGGQLVSDAIYSVGLTFDVGRNPRVQRMADGSPALTTGSRPRNLQHASGCAQCGFANIVGQNRITLIEIMSEQCGVCHEFEPRLASFAANHPELDVKQVELRSLSDAQIAELGIEATPTLLLYAADGSLRTKIIGTDLTTVENLIQ